MRFLIAATATACLASPSLGQVCSPEGVWQVVSAKVDGQAMPTDLQQVKLITNGRFTWVSGSADSVNTTPAKASGELRAFKTMWSGGGTYIVQGNTYTESIEYFPDVNWIGLTLPFTCQTDGDRFVQTGALPVFENDRKVRDVRIEETYRRLGGRNVAADRNAVSAALQSYRDAWLANDVARIVSHLHENVVVSSPPQPDLRGRAAVRDAWTKVLAGAKVKTLTLQEEPITVSGDLAISAGSFEETVEVQGQSQPMKLGGPVITVWQRAPEGAWKILRFMGLERSSPAQ
jgi:ketosteroid isomerase-like protein